MSSPEQAIPFSIPSRHHSLQAKVSWGDHVVTVGGDAPVRVIASDWWQAACSRGDWSLVYCTVGPGFTFEDFELLADRSPCQRPAGARLELI